MLVRAEYVEKASDEPSAGLRDSRSADADPHYRRLDRIHDVVMATARSWSTSYSHCWPHETSERNSPSHHLMLQLAHTMLNRDFSVFVEARQPGFPNQPIDVVGIAPGQDWFLAFCNKPIDATNAKNVFNQTTYQLSSFWLGDHLAAPSQGEYIERVARHCERGYGLVSATIWTAPDDEGDAVVKNWGRRSDLVYPALPADSSIHWMPPITLGQLPGRGNCQWLSACFPIPRGDVH